jgi:mannitol/fructose-specific phosphotransferase system IIA component (Ntr-type)
MRNEWLPAAHIALGVPASGVDDLVRAASDLLAAPVGWASAAIRVALQAACARGGFGIGAGVAVPHAELEGLGEPTVALLTTRAPLDVGAPDGVPADLFFVVLAPPDNPKSHLLTLAHIARLAHSRVLVRGLRHATTPDEAAALVAADELRRATRHAEVRPQAAQQTLVVVAMAGERAVDRLLVGLVERGFGSAAVLEAQTVGEAAAREIPLFAGFRDLFGDPGGQRVVLVDATADRAAAVVTLVREVCAELPATEARVLTLPLLDVQVFRPAAETSGGGH